MTMEQRTLSPGKLTTEPPTITAGNFKNYLVADDLLIDYFNVFLSLLSFPKQIWYNKESQLFEIIGDAKKNLLKQLKGLVQAYMPIDPIYNMTIKSKEQYPNFERNITAQHWKFDDKFTVECLDREQGITWIISERLPAFLKSDCYFEYRLAKLLSQLECKNLPVMVPKHFEVKGTPALQTVDRAEDIMKKAAVTQPKLLYTEVNEETTMTIVRSDHQSIINEQKSSHLSSGSSKSVEYDLPGISLMEEVLVSVEVEKPKVRSPGSRRYSKAIKLMNDHDKCIKDLHRPKVVDNEIFAFVPEHPLHMTGPTFLVVESENGTKHKVEGNEQVIMEDEVKTHEYKVGADDSTILQNSWGDQLSSTDAKVVTETEPVVSNSPDVNVESLFTVKDNGKGQHFAGNLIEEIIESDSSSEDDRDFCYTTPSHRYNFKNRRGIEKFRKFILGTAGEKYWWLWIDIERLKVIEDGKKRQRYLNLIQNRYLFSNGECYISAEARARLGLSLASQWTMEKLCQIQNEVAEPLLLYWGPRYCMNQEHPIRKAGVVLKNWEDRQLRSKHNAGPFPKSADIRLFDTNLDHSQKLEKDSVNEKKPKKTSFLTQPRVMQHGNLLKSGSDILKESLDKLLISVNSFMPEVSRSFEELELHRVKTIQHLEKLMQITKFQEALSSYKMIDLLQALQCESRTGYIFTHFCEQTGSLLWRNAINLWNDLTEYHQLFYAEIFQPFKLQRQAQYIFAKYIADGSSSDVELNAESRKSIYKQLEPPFEELFDQVEEHTLTLLLVPWIHMVEIAMSRFRKVNLVRETQHLDSAYYKKLQKLQNKIWPNIEIILPDHSPSYIQFQDEPRGENYWQKVPEKFRNYTLDSIIDSQLEIGNFQDFLGKHLAGVDLNCWLDIEHFRRIPHTAEEERSNKSREIKNKYLNRKYFFGPSSPATKAQQNEMLPNLLSSSRILCVAPDIQHLQNLWCLLLIMKLAGGWGKLLHEQLSSEVLVEIQRCMQRHIENKWLPMFLATPEFAERHRMQVQMQDVLEDQMFQQSKNKQSALKLMTNKWISTSEEIVTFRKALLNPVTVLQFQQFVSFKGELMENNVLFWLEVQKYKDMCHSKASDESIQNKIKAIINCFINSNVIPRLKIDIPQECADKIVNDMENQGIYIFREAQMAVFDVLFKLWPDFINFRQRVAGEGSLETNK